MNAAKGFSSMSNIMTSHKSKFQEDTSSSIELIAESYGANTNNAGALTDAELKAFLNIQKLFTSGAVSIVRTLQFGDIAGAWNLVDDSGSKGRHHTTMETENKVTAIFFSKEKLLDILSKDDKFKKALWKEAAIEVIGLYGIFDEAESGRSHHYHDITTMCHESSVYIAKSSKQEGDGMFVVPRGCSIFVLNGTVRIVDTVIESSTLFQLKWMTGRPLCMGHCVAGCTSTALSVMHLANPLMQHQADPIGQVLQSLAYSSKGGKMEILKAVMDTLTLTKLSQLVDNDKDFSKADQDKFVNDVMSKKRAAIVDAVARSEHFQIHRFVDTRPWRSSPRFKSVG